MKNVVRALTLALTVTGLTAATHASNSSTIVNAGKVDCVPVPSCEPNDPAACHIHGFTADRPSTF